MLAIPSAPSRRQCCVSWFYLPFEFEEESCLKSGKKFMILFKVSTHQRFDCRQLVLLTCFRDSAFLMKCNKTNNWWWTITSLKCIHLHHVQIHWNKSFLCWCRWDKDERFMYMRMLYSVSGNCVDFWTSLNIKLQHIKYIFSFKNHPNVFCEAFCLFEWTYC